ncbi:hypothetical protein IWQ60_007687 [Tieghemiomyces parasiticus]|uniref:Uncharacterized protein n=1 Tax=Tieghemiomyces parasiticus TaxID=78921 RepID=A0A9W8DNE0_9FUNG|nr:hypothetical protein IWQ60_007687 [Tieghemiomyces parasiticus]
MVVPATLTTVEPAAAAPPESPRLFFLILLFLMLAPSYLMQVFSGPPLLSAAMLVCLFLLASLIALRSWPVLTRAYVRSRRPKTGREHRFGQLYRTLSGRAFWQGLVTDVVPNSVVDACPLWDGKARTLEQDLPTSRYHLPSPADSVHPSVDANPRSTSPVPRHNPQTPQLSATDPSDPSVASPRSISLPRPLSSLTPSPTDGRPFPPPIATPPFPAPASRASQAATVPSPSLLPSPTSPSPSPHPVAPTANSKPQTPPSVRSPSVPAVVTPKPRLARMTPATSPTHSEMSAESSFKPAADPEQPDSRRSTKSSRKRTSKKSPNATRTVPAPVATVSPRITHPSADTTAARSGPRKPISAPSSSIPTTAQPSTAPPPSPSAGSIFSPPPCTTASLGPSGHSASSGPVPPVAELVADSLPVADGLAGIGGPPLHRPCLSLRASPDFTYTADWARPATFADGLPAPISRSAGGSPDLTPYRPASSLSLRSPSIGPVRGLAGRGDAPSRPASRWYSPFDPHWQVSLDFLHPHPRLPRPCRRPPPGFAAAPSGHRPHLPSTRRSIHGSLTPNPDESVPLASGGPLSTSLPGTGFHQRAASESYGHVLSGAFPELFATTRAAAGPTAPLLDLSNYRPVTRSFAAPLTLPPGFDPNYSTTPFGETTPYALDQSAGHISEPASDTRAKLPSGLAKPSHH